MLTWLLSFLGIIVALISLAAQFYFRWVPDVEEQKRHVKRAFGWCLDFSVFSLLVLNFVLEASRKGPVTPFFVVEVAVNVGIATLYLVLFFYRRWSLEKVDTPLLDITGEILNCLEIIAKDQNLSEQTVGKLRRKLYGKPPSTE